MTPAVQAIADRCSQLFGLPSADVLGPRRFGYAMPARFALYAALRSRGWTQSQIARSVGRERTTIRDGLIRAEAMADRDPHYAAQLRQLMSDDVPPAAPWAPTPADVLSFVAQAAKEHPNRVLQLAPMSSRCAMLRDLAAHVAIRAGMPPADVVEALRMHGGNIEQTAALFESRWLGDDGIEDLLERTRAQFPQKTVA